LLYGQFRDWVYGERKTVELEDFGVEKVTEIVSNRE
jgi:hypothetical protein